MLSSWSNDSIMCDSIATFDVPLTMLGLQDTLAFKTITQHAKRMERRGYSTMVDRLQRRPPSRDKASTTQPSLLASVNQPPTPPTSPPVSSHRLYRFMVKDSSTSPNQGQSRAPRGTCSPTARPTNCCPTTAEECRPAYAACYFTRTSTSID
eukprot:scaffold595351_cov32-Prasinocladus_malaysianus.AAC.1